MDNSQIEGGRLGSLRPRSNGRKRAREDEYTYATVLPKSPPSSLDDNRNTRTADYDSAFRLRPSRAPVVPSRGPEPNNESTAKASPEVSEGSSATIEPEESYNLSSFNDDQEANTSLQESIVQNSNIPRHLQKATRELWQSASKAVQNEDGTIKPFAVVNWIMTRKGGVSAQWNELEEGYKAIEDMRKETLDVGRILNQRAEGVEEENRKAKRRRENKLRYRARGPLAKKAPQVGADEKESG